MCGWDEMVLLDTAVFLLVHARVVNEIQEASYSLSFKYTIIL